MLAIILKNNKQQQKHRTSEAKIHVQVEYDLQAPGFQCILRDRTAHLR